MPTHTANRRWRRLQVALWILAVVLTGVAAVTLTVWRAPLWVADRLTRLQLARAGIHSRWLMLDGMRIHYMEGGAGQPVVLVHGLASQAQHDWSRLAPALVHAGYHIFAPDLPGFGQSDKPASRTYSIPEQAGFVASFMDAHHLHETALAGFSMGGWIAATVALEQPRRVSRLLLFDSAGLLFQPPFDAQLFTPSTSEQVDRFLALVGDSTRLPEFVKQDFLETTRRNGWVVRRAWDSMMAGRDALDSKFSGLKMPLLIVWGKQDHVIPPALGESMHAAVPPSVLAVCEDAGHIAPVTCADRINPTVLAFLSGAGLQPGQTIALPAKKP